MLDRNGKTIKVGDMVRWLDPCVELTQEELDELPFEYEVYKISGDIVYLASPWSECEALPSECEVITNPKNLF